MKKFQFRLERLLNIKINKEKLLTEELARLTNRRNSHQDVKLHFEKELEEERATFMEKQSFSSESFEREQHYIQYVRNQIYHQELMIKDYELKMDKKREEIIENRKEIRVLERLKEKKFEEYAYEVMMDDRKLMDEIANQRGAMAHDT